jgi:hypothetical protein
MTAGIALAVLVALTVAVFYDARGRQWTGRTGPVFWGAWTFLCAIVAIPCYLIARTRTAKRSAPPRTAGPGWYQDPTGEHSLRYWDGRSWTPQTADE